MEVRADTTMHQRIALAFGEIAWFRLFAISLIVGIIVATGHVDPQRAYAETSTSAGVGAAEAGSDDREFNVRDFGVDGTGKHDAQAGIAAALKAASDWTTSAGRRHARVVFPPGIYDLSTVSSIYAIQIMGMHDIDIVGTLDATDRSRSSVLIGAPASLSANKKNVVYNSFFHIESSNNIVISGFYLDKLIPYFSQGTVIRAEAASASIDVSPDAGYMDVGSDLSRERIDIVSFFDGYAARTWEHSAEFCGIQSAPAGPSRACLNWHILKREPLNDGMWRLTLDRAPPQAIAGKKFLLWRNIGWQYGFLVDQSNDVQIRDIFYTGGGGPAVHIQASDGLNLVRNLVVDVPKGSNRLLAATSGVNAGGNRGHIELDHIAIRQVDDDAFHISAGRYYPVLSQSPANDTLVLGSCYPGEFKVGDHIAAFDWSLKADVASAVVTDARITAPVDPSKSPRQCTISLDRPLPPLHGLGSYDPRMVGQAKDNNDRIVNHSQSAHLRITGSFFSSMRAHCGIIQVPASYSGNRCADTPYAGLLVGPEYPWGEGYVVDGVTIENSSFANIGGTAICVGDSSAEPSQPNITSACDTKVSDVIGRADNRSIVIRHNAFARLGMFESGFSGVSGLAISIGNASDARIDDNLFSDGSPVEVSVAPKSTQNVEVRN